MRGNERITPISLGTRHRILLSFFIPNPWANVNRVLAVCMTICYNEKNTKGDAHERHAEKNAEPDFCPARHWVHSLGTLSPARISYRLDRALYRGLPHPKDLFRLLPRVWRDPFSHGFSLGASAALSPLLPDFLSRGTSHSVGGLLDMLWLYHPRRDKTQTHSPKDFLAPPRRRRAVCHSPHRPRVHRRI